jgi:hypothetical protein
MRLAPLVLAAGLVVGGAACSDDEPEAPPATGTEDAFCGELRTAIIEHSTIFDPLAPTSPADTEAATAALADAAPAEVAEPMRLLADTFAAVADVLDRFDPSEPEAAQAIEDLDLDQVAIGDAQAAVLAYARDTCGIDLEAINAASVTTTTVAATVPTTVPGTVPATTSPPTTG